MPTYKLSYFDIRGLAETSRMILAVGKQEYEDFRYPFSMGTPGDFSTLKKEEFDADKAAGKLDAAMGGKVPLLEVDGKYKVGQSKSIERYLSRKLGLYGANDEEGAQVDAMAENVRDLKDVYQKGPRAAAADEKEAKMKEYFEKTLPEDLAKFEKSLPGSNGFAVGDKISYADISIYAFLYAPKCFFDNADGARAAMANCPKLKAICENVDKNPEMKAWIEKRKETPM